MLEKPPTILAGDGFFCGKILWRFPKEQPSAISANVGGFLYRASPLLLGFLLKEKTTIDADAGRVGSVGVPA